MTRMACLLHARNCAPPYSSNCSLHVYSCRSPLGSGHRQQKAAHGGINAGQLADGVREGTHAVRSRLHDGMTVSVCPSRTEAFLHGPGSASSSSRRRATARWRARPSESARRPSSCVSARLLAAQSAIPPAGVAGRGAGGVVNLMVGSPTTSMEEVYGTGACKWITLVDLVKLVSRQLGALSAISLSPTSRSRRHRASGALPGSTAIARVISWTSP
jgi:hypothetical protein